jgi:hypothetical protein
MGLWRGISGIVACVLTELGYLVATRQGTRAAGAIIRYAASRVAAGRWEVPAIGPLLLAAHAVLEDYPTIGLAGAMNVMWLPIPHDHFWKARVGSQIIAARSHQDREGRMNWPRLSPLCRSP